MKKFAALFILASGSAFSQTTWGIQAVNAPAPTGSCSNASLMRQVIGVGLYQCISGTWTSISSGGAVVLQTAVQGTAAQNVLTTFPAITDYVYSGGAVPGGGMTLSGAITTVSGSKTVTITGGIAPTSANIGQPIVIFSRGTTNEFQSTITSAGSGTFTVADNADVSASGRYGYWAPDCTAAIDASFAAMVAAGQNPSFLHIPAGNFFYNGTGMSGVFSPHIYGDGVLNSRIFLGVGKYFVNASNSFNTSDVHDLTFEGGAGAVRSTYTGQNVNGFQRYHGLALEDYSGPAISFNSSDIPYLDVYENDFRGLNDQNTIGVANAGSDLGWIHDNAFRENRVNIKLGGGGVGEEMWANDNIQFAEENPVSTYTRVGLWVVPSVTAPAASSGLTVDGKFGNENLDTQDVRVLFADTVASSGSTYFGDTLWLTTASTGYISSMYFHPKRVSGGTIGGTGSGVNPLVYSYTPNIRTSTFSAVIDGAPPGYVIQFDPVVTAVNDYTNRTNRFGPFDGGSSTGANNITISNIPGFGSTVDPNGQVSNADVSVDSPYRSGAGAAGFANLLTTAITSFTLVSGATKATITDPYGGTDAVTYTAASSGTSYIYTTLNTDPTIGKKIWITFDIREGSSGTPQTQALAELTDSTGNNIFAQLCIGCGVGSPLTTTWQSVKIPYVLRASSTGTVLRFGRTGTASDTLDIADVRVYQDQEPSDGGMLNNPLIFGQDNKWSIGENGANRPSKIYTGGSVNAGSSLTVPATGEWDFISRLAVNALSDGIIEFQNSEKTAIASLLTGTVVTPKTSAYSVLYGDSGTLFTNTGAGGSVTFTLPTPVIGLTYTFDTTAAQTEVIQAAGSAIICNVSCGATNGTATSGAQHSIIKMIAVSTTEWDVVSVIGTWTVI